MLNIKRQTESQIAGQSRCWAGWSLTWARAVKMRTERAARDCWHIKLTPTPLSVSFSGSRFDLNENSSIFRPLPASDVDIMGKKRFVGKTSSGSFYIFTGGLNASL